MKKVKRRLLIILYIIAVVGLGILIYAVPEFKQAVTKTTILSYGNLQIKDDVTCYFIMDEQVYSAGQTGTINYYIEDGVQVRKGAKVLAVSPSSVSTDADGNRPAQAVAELLSGSLEKTETYAVSAPCTVSYYVDGYEAYFTPESMRSLRYEDVADKEFTVHNLVREDTLEGEPLYKLCKTQKWYMAAWVEAGNVSKYAEGEAVTVNLPDGSVKAEIIDIIEDGDRWLVLFESNRYYKGLTSKRCESATVITSDYSGILIDNASITTKDGQVGVYKKLKNGEYTFVRISVITTNGEQSLAEVSYFYDDEGNMVDTVEIYDEILKKPKADK